MSPDHSAGAGACAGCLTRAHILLAAIEGDRYPALRHLAARALGDLLSVVPRADERAARTARGIDATGDDASRARAVASVRAALAAGACDAALTSTSANDPSGAGSDRRRRC